MIRFLPQTLISKRAELYRSKSELRAANSRLVKGLRGMDKRLNPQNTKVRECGRWLLMAVAHLNSPILVRTPGAVFCEEGYADR